MATSLKDSDFGSSSDTVVDRITENAVCYMCNVLN